ncbi:hypothetical protein DYB32_010705 [Aphanomyces invadans]|uniref:DUF6818 domain-containing protein n=1 Tax=Aphanomyces invadans TaxID=157072 RepID=A0A3R6ZGM5_9STRA|nr:hypothetical protein DYB32_010705 [Aphanomyces invadans]
MVKRAKGRGKSWCPGSVELMLDHIDDVMPAGGNEWEEVAAGFNGGPYPFRDSDAIKRKYYMLRNHAKTTGDPTCPPEVVRAKLISRRIDANCAVLNLEDNEGDGAGDDSHDDASEQGTHTTLMLCCTDVALDENSQADINEFSPPMPRGVVERPSRTGMSTSELAVLGRKLKRSAPGSSGGMMSYVAKKRQSIDKFIDGAMESDAKGSTDMLSMILLMDERAAQREEKRFEKELEWRQQQQQREERVERDRAEREARREEMQLVLFSKIFGNK